MTSPPGASGNGPVVARRTVPPDDSVVHAVALCVAGVSDEPVDELPPLHETVDADALETLFAGADREGHLTFPYCGFVVAVTSDRDVSVHDPEGLTADADGERG